jgi:hypothetical protein
VSVALLVAWWRIRSRRAYSAGWLLTPVVVAAITAVGVVLGAFFQHFFSARLGQRNTSGTVQTSEATRLWDAMEKMVGSSTAQLEAERAARIELEQRHDRERTADKVQFRQELDLMRESARSREQDLTDVIETLNAAIAECSQQVTSLRGRLDRRGQS